jgi:hypothetical protein
MIVMIVKHYYYQLLKENVGIIQNKLRYNANLFLKFI